MNGTGTKRSVLLPLLASAMLAAHGRRCAGAILLGSGRAGRACTAGPGGRRQARSAVAQGAGRARRPPPPTVAPFAPPDLVPPPATGGQVCAKADFEAVVDDAAGALRDLNLQNKPAFQEKLRQLKDKRGWSHDAFLKEAAPFVRDDKIAVYDQDSERLLTDISTLGQEGADAPTPDCALLADLKTRMQTLVDTQTAKWTYMFAKLDAALAVAAQLSVIPEAGISDLIRPMTRVLPTSLPSRWGRDAPAAGSGSCSSSCASHRSNSRDRDTAVPSCAREVDVLEDHVGAEARGRHGSDRRSCRPSRCRPRAGRTAQRPQRPASRDRDRVASSGFSRYSVRKVSMTLSSTIMRSRAPSCRPCRRRCGGRRCSCGTGGTARTSASAGTRARHETAIAVARRGAWSASGSNSSTSTRTDTHAWQPSQ